VEVLWGRQVQKTGKKKKTKGKGDHPGLTKEKGGRKTPEHGYWTTDADGDKW